MKKENNLSLEKKSEISKAKSMLKQAQMDYIIHTNNEKWYVYNKMLKILIKLIGR